MSLTPDEDRLLSQLHKNLRQDELEPGHPFWVDFREERFKGAVGPDVVRQLARDVSWAEAGTVAFFSGFRGAGKSTELNRLRNVLRDEGFAVAKFNVEDYLAVRFPITAGQLVLAMAAGIWAACAEQGWVDPDDDRGSPARRLWDWVRSVRIDLPTDVTVKPPVVPAEVDLHFRLDRDFRDQLGAFLRARAVELNEQATEYFTDLDAQVRDHFVALGREWRGMVVIVDSLDHARSETAFSDVRNALREVFDLQLPLVRFRPFRTVFCIPPYLFPATGTVRRIFNVKVADRTGGPATEGVDALVETVQRRLPPGLTRAGLLADADVERLACCSGGHIRDLLRLVDEVILGAEAIPATAADVDAAIVRLRSSFPPLADDQRMWLDRIADTKQLALAHQDGWDGLAELLDYHMVLTYSNGDEWYTVHPVIAGLLAREAGSG